MSQSVYSEREIIHISFYTDEQLAKSLRGYSVVHALDIRREIQRGLAAYSRKYKYDDIQGNLLNRLQKIEKWCRGRFMKDRMMELIRTNSECAKSKALTKNMAKKEWETLIVRWSY